MADKILQRGAEALIVRKDSSVTKKRVKKSYRLPEIDEKIRKLRTRTEGKILERAAKIISVPAIKKIDENNKELVMDFVPGKRLSDCLDSFSLSKQKKTCKALGQQIAKLHDADLIHGDLTTSNMILNKDEIFLIDFGLGFHSIKPEDKAVDLHLLKEALEAKHFSHWQSLFAEFLKGYKSSKNAKKTLEQFKKVEARGRYKDSY